MNEKEYQIYRNAVADFMKREGLRNLSGRSKEPYFSRQPCVCCGTKQGGYREDAEGFNPTAHRMQRYEFVCSDCVYYAEYGRLDDKTMKEIEMSQTYNPLGFYCASNHATPDYVSYSDFRMFVAYGLIECWLSADPDDPNDGCSFCRPFALDDVRELRLHFLDLLETVVVSLWNRDFSPGDGEIDGDWQSLVIGDAILTWYVRLDNDAIMMELFCSGSDPAVIWLNYSAIEDRKNVLAVLTEAENTIGGEVWYKLVDLVEEKQ